MIGFLPLILGTISAWHGGRIVGGFNKTLKNVCWMLPFLITSLVYNPIGFAQLFNIANISKGIGHGRGLRLHEPMEIDSDPEYVEFLIFWLQGRIPLYWYKVLIMALAGLVPVLGSVIAFGVHNPVAGAVIALGGLFKGINAMIFDLDTEVREYADGVAAGSALLWAVLMIA